MDDVQVGDIRVRRDRNAELVAIAEDFEVPTPLTIEVSDWKGLDVRLELDLIDGKYQIRDLRMSRREDGPHVSVNDIRTVPIPAFIRTAVPAASTMPDDLPSKAFDGPTGSNIRWTANIYKLAYVSGDSPRQAVADTFRIPAPTASRWIARAREKGLLGKATFGRAGV